ncbi:MAG: oligosaccharide flippase family protein [Acutalibacteraceae bacterium]|nr:oligosaccharide flippase family protein [Acutalibacteraceae bacterium]
MAEKNTSKQMTINLLASIISFGVNMAINFFLTPYLVQALGTESYGFIGLANNFVQYATIITSALNSMSGRFISIAYHQGDKKKASKLFSSVLVADLFLAGVMLLAAGLFTGYLEVFLDVPAKLIGSVKITFGITFLTFVISVVTAIFTTATFVKNRLEINSIRDIISNLLKIALIVILFTCFPAKLYFIALATLASGVFLLLTNITVKKKILPDVQISFKNFKFKYVKIILAAGLWMSLAQLSNALISGVDLLMCNLALGATMMGILSIAKTIPHCISSLIATIGGVFAPHYTILYAKDDIKGLVKEVSFTSRILSFILTVPIAGFIAFGYEFYTLWQPSKSPEEIQVIQILSVLTCVTYLFTAHTQCMTMLNSVCNKLKLPVLVALGVGVVSIAITVFVINVYDLGDNNVYVIAGTSSVLMSLRAFFFIPIYSAHLLKQKLTSFFPSMLRGWLAFFVLVAIFTAIRNLIALDTWLVFAAACLVAAIVGYAISIPIMFSFSEIKELKNKFLKKLK